MSDVQHLQFCFTDLFLIYGTICLYRLGQLYTSEDLLATGFTDCGKEEYRVHKALSLSPSGKSILQNMLLNFSCYPRGSATLKKTMCMILNISQIPGEHKTCDASGAFLQSESFLPLMTWSWQLLLLHLLENSAKAVRESRRLGQD